jgi:hypothetical protein
VTVRTWLGHVVRRIRAVGQPPHPTEQQQRSAEEMDGSRDTGTLAHAIDRALDAYDRHRQKQDRDSRINRAIATCAILIALAAAIFGGFQWYEMRTAVDISRQTLDISSRAWIFGSLSDARKPYLADNNMNPTFIFNIRNTGKSPAFSVRHGVICTLHPGRPDAVVSQGGDLTVTVDGTIERKLKCLFMKPDELRAFDEKSRAFYAWLVVLYRDPLTIGSDRMTMECWRRLAGPAQEFDSCEHGANVYK